MDNNPFTPATGSISSRFETQTAIDEAKETRQKEWKEAYARIGQEPPPQEPDEEYDPRTLFERLQTKKDLKKEEWDSKMKLSNQWRGLDSEEQRFLAEKEAEKKAEQRKLEEKEAEELREYREKLAARHSTTETPALASSSTAATAPKKPAAKAKPVRKDVKSLMKGVVVKKKAKPSTPASASASNSTASPATASASASVPAASAPGVSDSTPKLEPPIDTPASTSTSTSTSTSGFSPTSGAGTKRVAPDENVPSTGEDSKEPPVENDEKRRKVDET